MAYFKPIYREKKEDNYIPSKQINNSYFCKRAIYRRRILIFILALLVGVGLFFHLSASVGSIRKQSTWENEADITSDRALVLQWQVTDKFITMQITGRTTGFVGIAFSFNADMNNSDVVIGWVKDGVAYIEDRHSNSNGRTVLDKHQDYELIYGYENRTHTIIRFRRKLITCDEDDFNITMSTARIWWTLGDTDMDDAEIKHMNFKEPTSGLNFFLLTFPKYKKPIGSHIKNYDLVFDKVPISGYFKTLYWCKYFHIPQFEQKRQVVGYEVYSESDQHMNKVHHHLIYHCDENEISKKMIEDKGHMCYTSGYANLDWMCHKQMMVTAKNLKADYYPEHIGYPFGSTANKSMYVLLQIHYDEIQVPRGGLNFRHGVRLLYTTQLRPNDANGFIAGIKDHQFIPAKQTAFRSVGICAPSCTQRFPKDGIHIFRMFLHAHLTTRKFILHHYRNGIEINYIEEENFQFNYQPPRYLRNEITMLPNDSLAVECVTDNTRSETISSGIQSEAEMCVVLIQYYPPVDIGRCWSIVDDIALTRLASIPHFTWDKLPMYNTVNIVLRLYDNFVADFIMRRFVNWTAKRTELENIYLKGYHLPHCTDSGHGLDYWTGDYVKFSDFTPMKKPTCSLDSSEHSRVIITQKKINMQLT